jgi:hypothetical protein
VNTLLDSYGKPSGFLYNNIILLPQTYEVAGVVLGHCVFGPSGKAKGKLFNKTFYSATGEMLAREQAGNTPTKDLNITKAMHEAWAILQQIKDHNCPWIEPKDRWASVSVKDFLLT